MKLINCLNDQCRKSGTGVRELTGVGEIIQVRAFRCAGREWIGRIT